MMEQIAKVVSYTPEGKLLVEVEIASACNHCASDKQCGTSAVAKAFPKKTQQLIIPTDNTDYLTGDMLKLGLSESIFLKATALIYLFPLVGLLLGALIGQMLQTQLLLAAGEWVNILFACLGAITSWFIGKQLVKKLEQQSTPIILKHLGRQLDASS